MIGSEAVSGCSCGRKESITKFMKTFRLMQDKTVQSGGCFYGTENGQSRGTLMRIFYALYVVVQFIINGKNYKQL